MEEEQTQDDEVLTVDEAAALCKCGSRAIREALTNGSLTGRNIGGSTGWRTTRAACLEWIETGNAA